MSRPDAVKIPFLFEDKAYRPRAHAVLDVAEEILRPDKPNGERAYVRRNAGEYFATRDPFEAEFHAANSERRGQSRYVWEAAKGKPGVLVGRLKSDGKPEKPKEADGA